MLYKVIEAIGWIEDFCRAINFQKNSLNFSCPSFFEATVEPATFSLGGRHSIQTELREHEDRIASFFKMFRIDRFIMGNLGIYSDGHNILVTPDPVPNSEVKLDVFVFVLSLMGRHEAVYL